MLPALLAFPLLEVVVHWSTATLQVALLLPLTLSLRPCWPSAKLASLWLSAWATMQPVEPTSYQVRLLLLLRDSQQLLHQPVTLCPCLGGAGASLALLRPQVAGSSPEALLRAANLLFAVQRLPQPSWPSLAPSLAALALPMARSI